MTDTPIAPPWWRTKYWPLALTMALMVALAVATAMALAVNATRSVRLREAALTFATVEPGIYHDFIPLRGTVAPRDVIYLDALEGGRVEQVLVAPGDEVVAGQVLIELSNTDLELDVLDREARLIDSITQLQTYETQLEQNRLGNEKALQQIDYDVARLDRSIRRLDRLVPGGLVPMETRDSLQEQLDYARALRPLQAQSNHRQSELRLQQLPAIKSQLKALQKDIEITRNKLDNLKVRAPRAGRMTAIDLKVGEHRNRGERLGELTPDTGYKLVAYVDEFYLEQVAKDQRAQLLPGAHSTTLRVQRVYPQVSNGVFAVDLAFENAPPSGLLAGQALQARLELGGDGDAMILRSGAFLESSGGRWVFVRAPHSRVAQRRSIKIGRRNAEQVEILDGLKAGEVVLISDYAGLENIDRIDLEPDATVDSGISTSSNLSRERSLTRSHRRI